MLESRSGWIFNSQLKLKDRKSDITPSKNSFLYMGKNVPYAIHTMSDSDKISLLKSQFHVFTKSKSIDRNKIKKMHDDWLTARYSSYIKNKIDGFCKILDVEPKGFEIKDLKSKWGSATVSNKIHLNLHLLKTPRKMIDYVILHELIHLKIKGHPHEFWACLEKIMPDYEARKSWLDRNYVEVLSS